MSRKIISGDKIADMARWEPPGVGAKASFKDQYEKRRQELLEHELAAARETGFRQGYEQGVAEGIATGSREVNLRINHLESLLRVMTEPLERFDEHVEEQLTRLAILIAKQVIRREIKTDPGQIVAVVREAVSVLPLSAHKIRIFLHPEDALVVRNILPSGVNSSNWEIIDDPVMSRGGCRVDTEMSHIDATVESRLSAIATTLLGGERANDKQSSPGQ